ncbi:MAG TPA: hypothetical protein VJ508_09845 [Saprospiraceae bacterium]|nr:hypothetical protein [Saprospiraceae bacterium]
MRLLILISMIFMLWACGSHKNMMSHAYPLDGTWIPVRQEFGGMTLHAAAFNHQSLILKDSTYTVMAESVDKGIVQYHDQKMDIYGREGVNAGKHFTALYKFDHGQLTICYDLKGGSYPSDFTTKANTMLFLAEFKRQ